MQLTLTFAKLGLLQMQAGVAGISTEFPRPSRHTRRARASRLAPLPATSAAHDPHKVSATLPPLDPPDIVSRHMDDAAAHSGACSGHDIGPAISASTEARACSCNGLEDPQADPQADLGADAEPMVQQPREGTPVSSNRRHYRVSPSFLLCHRWHRKSSSLRIYGGPLHVMEQCAVAALAYGAGYGS